MQVFARLAVKLCFGQLRPPAPERLLPGEAERAQLPWPPAAPQAVAPRPPGLAAFGFFARPGRAPD